MKNKLGKFLGFTFGASAFLFLFKMLFLNRISPSDELAPGIVVLMAIVVGSIVAFFGGYLQGIINIKKVNQ